MSTFEYLEHPFPTFIKPSARTLVVGTFPTAKKNRTFNFYYASKTSKFWGLMEDVFQKSFRHHSGIDAIQERRRFLETSKIGITDMHQSCYRKNDSSKDEDLYSVELTDIFKILDEYPCIDRLVFTSRTEAVGALGLFQTYRHKKGLNPIRTKLKQMYLDSFARSSE